MELYKLGADYVLTPHFLGGDYLANMLKNIKTDKEGYKNKTENTKKYITFQIRN